MVMLGKKTFVVVQNIERPTLRDTATAWKRAYEDNDRMVQGLQVWFLGVRQAVGCLRTGEGHGRWVSNLDSQAVHY